jgi:dephospho-CoA kinase
MTNEKLQNKKIIVAVVGLPGAGKTEVTKFFVEKGFKKIYFGDVTFEELKRRKLEINETNERLVREELRKKYGMAAYAILNLPKIKKNFKEGNVVLESLYSWDEYKVIKKEFGNSFYTIAVYAPPEVRYTRLAQRKERPLTLDEAKSRDYAQIENLAIAGPIAIADFTIVNTGTLEELFAETEKVFGALTAES